MGGRVGVMMLTRVSVRIRARRRFGVRVEIRVWHRVGSQSISPK